MKIKDVQYEEYLRGQPVAPPPNIRGRRGFPYPPGKVPFPVLRIITDDGIEGFAFGNRQITERELSRIKQVIIGRDPFDREWIWQTLWSFYDYGRGTRYWEISIGALSAVDIALWDLAGKALGQPIYKLLGAYRDKIKIYASSFRKPTPQDYYDDVISCKQRGITAYKLHVNPDIAIEACRAARRAAGDDMTLMLDGGTGGSREQALQVGRELEKLNFYWFEQPVPDHDIEGLVKLREKLNVPICATECHLMSMFSIPEYLLRRAVDMVRCDTLVDGGITPVKKIADMCDAFGMQCEIHQHAGGAVDIANLHVECAIKNSAFHEMFWPDIWRYGIKEAWELDNEGYLHVPQKPGLGVEIDWKSLGKLVRSY